MSLGRNSQTFSVRDGGLVAKAIEQIADLISSGDLGVGDSLPSEVRLSERLNVSRTVVREAVGSLAALGLLDTGNGRPPRVARATSLPITISINHALQTRQIAFSQVWQARECLETRAAMLAAQYRSPEEAHRLMVIAEALVSETGHIDRVVELEVEFHNLIATASRNILMGHLLESFVPLMREAIPAAWRTRKTSLERQRVHDAHRRVAKAILDKDAKAAEEAMSHHFDDDVYIGLLSYE